MNKLKIFAGNFDISVLILEELKDAKGVIRIRKSYDSILMWDFRKNI